VATHWHAFLNPELHGLLTPRTSFLNPWQTNTCFTAFGPAYRTRAFAQIETKRSTRVFLFSCSFIPQGKNPDQSRHVEGRDGHQPPDALMADAGSERLGRQRNHKIIRQWVNTPMALINVVGLGL
jgi:hypothetical protein